MLTIEANCIIELDHLSALNIACRDPPNYDISRYLVVDIGQTSDRGQPLYKGQAS